MINGTKKEHMVHIIKDFMYVHIEFMFWQQEILIYFLTFVELDLD